MTGTGHSRYRMAEMPFAQRDNQGGTVDLSAPDSCQGRFFIRTMFLSGLEVRMKKKRIALLLVLAMVLTLGLLTGCKKTEGNPLPEGMDEAAVLDAGREVVALLTAEDYQAVVDRMRPDVVASGVTAANIKTAMDGVAKAGKYVEESDAMATGQTDKDSGEEYAVAAIFAKHEKKGVRYRVAFDQDMNLIGLQIRKY